MKLKLAQDSVHSCLVEKPAILKEKQNQRFNR